MGCEHCGETHESSNLFCPNTGKLMPSKLLPEGTLLEGKYRIGPSIGLGGMGAVFEARHTLLDKRVAIKVMLPEGGAEMARQFSARMVREARAASATGHRNIAQVTDMGWVQQGSLFVVMEYLEGHTLRHVLEQEGQMSVGRAARLMGQVLAGLDVVHKNGIVHRDLKPENLMIVEDDDAQELIKILDFGISKQVKGEQDLNLTSTGLVIGTPQYMSPEQAKNSAKIDHRTDIYSAGAILYRMVTGTLPHQHETLNALIAAVLAAPIDPPSRRRPGLSRALDSVILKALARDPDQRYENAREFRDALRPLEAATVAVVDEPQAAPPPPSVFAEVDESLLVDLDAAPAPPPSAPPAPAPTPAPTAVPAPRTAGPAPQQSPPAAGGGDNLFAPPEEEDELALELDSGVGAGSPVPARAEPEAVAPSTASAAAPASMDALRSTGPYGQARRGHGQANLWIALAVVAVGGFLVWRFALREEQPVAAARPDGGDYVEVRIEASPRWAEVSVDGVQLTSNPLVLQRSSREYIVTVRAKGHFSQTQAFTPTENRSLLIELKPKAPPPEPPEPD